MKGLFLLLMVVSFSLSAAEDLQQEKNEDRLTPAWNSFNKTFPCSPRETREKQVLCQLVNLGRAKNPLDPLNHYEQGLYDISFVSFMGAQGDATIDGRAVKSCYQTCREKGTMGYINCKKSCLAKHTTVFVASINKTVNIMRTAAGQKYLSPTED